MNPSLPESTGYFSSAMSELDSLSDSDWLDISSGHASEDNESVSSHESDRDTSSRPHSRRSSISSRDGEVEAWEGFAYDSSDEATPLASGMYPLPLARAGSADLQRIPLGLIPDIETDQDRAEDERVKEALDQSLIGTLSASRSSTTSGLNHSSPNGVRDLRLSFPDPLNSSRDELNRSYEDVSPSEANFTDADAPAPSLTAPHSPMDPGKLPAKLTVPESEAHEVHLSEPLTIPDIEIHLYGSSTEYKWAFVQDLLQKVADGCGQFLTKPLDPVDGLVHIVHLENDDEDSKALFKAVRIYDRTEDNVIPEALVAADSPSLGIVFLPHIRLPSLSIHDFYLPVLAKNEILDMTYNSNTNAMRTAAEDDWDLLCVPSARLFPIKEVLKSYIATQDGLRGADTLEVRDAMEVLMNGTPKKVMKPASEQSASINAVTIFALVSLIVGFACNTTFHSSPAPTKTVNLTTPNNTWLSVAAGPNRSNNLPLHYASGKTELVTSVKDMALSVYNPGVTSISLTPQIKSVNPTSEQSPASAQCVKCVTPAVADKPSTQEVAIVPAQSSRTLEECPLSSSPLPTHTPSLDDPVEVEDYVDIEEIQVETAVGLKLVDSLSEALGITTKALMRAVNDDSGDLFDSLDDFVETIRSQTDEIIKQSKGKARAISEQVQHLGETLHSRNDRARSRAKELRKKGEQLIHSASERVRERTDIARKRAHGIRQSVEGSDVWQAYLGMYDDHWGSQEDGDYWGIRSRCIRTRDGSHRSGRFRLSCE